MDDRLLVLSVADRMERHLLDPETKLDLEQITGYSENRLRQKFYNVVGETPSGYLRKRRLTEAARALMRGERIVDVANVYGYSSQDNFTTAFKSWFGLTPGELQATERQRKNCLERMKEPLNMMELTNLKQSSLSTTLMSSMKGASEFFDLDWTIAKLFGYSTHAFVLNIHKDLCPSSPYCWNKDLLFLALRNMGIRRSGTINLRKDSSAAERSEAEKRVKAHLDAGNVCILDSLEHQLISGYDIKGFLLLQPWQCVPDVVRTTLSFGTENEALEKEGWVGFTLIEKEEYRAKENTLLEAALSMTLRMRADFKEFSYPDYAFGDQAWVQWMDGVERGCGKTHGHWWSGSVWMECRQMASKFFSEIESMAKTSRASALCLELSDLYRECSLRLDIARNKEAESSVQKKALAEGREFDSKCAELMKELLTECLA